VDGRSLARQLLDFHEFIAPHVIEWALMFLPLAVYLMVMGTWVNRQGHPVAASGRWNLVGLLFGVSGFLLLGPPAWLAGLFRYCGEIGYWTAYGSYILILLAVATWLVRRQRHTLVLYNVEPNAFAEMLREVLEDSGLPFQATPGRVALENNHVVLDIESSTALSSVTLRWLGEGREKQVLGPQIIEAVSKMHSEPSAIGLLMTAASCLLLAFAIYGFALYVFFVP
jgi:hypothetical protein